MSGGAGAVSGARRAAVLGHPVGHSLSPVLHRAAYAALGLTGWDYGLHDVDEGALGDFLAALEGDWAGLSLTMPLKQVALQHVDVVEPLADSVGAVNTILFQPGGLRVGANTDVHGLVQALREAQPVPAGRALSSGVIVGGGATAASALAALGELGVRRPVVAVRNIGRAGVVIRAAATMGLEPEYVTLGTDRAADAIRHAQALISTVPAGASADLVPVLEGVRLDPAQVLLDVVYEGWPTPFPARWSQAGGSVSPGYLMLLHQACEQVRLMTGTEAPERAMREALLRAIGYA